MARPRRVLWCIGTLVLGFVTLPLLAGTSVTRGPYLQVGTPNGITVRWRTDAATDSRVRYGTSATNLNLTADHAAVTTEHVVSIDGLGADTRYFYSVGSTTGTLAGGTTNHFFVTSPPAGSAKPTRIWVLGDSGTADANARAVRNAYLSFAGADAADLLLLLGDSAYDDGTDAEFQAALFDTYPTILRHTVLWPAYGNHEGHSSDSPTQTGPYYDVFSLPTAAQAGGVASGTEAYYSFDYGNIHFVCLDSDESDRSVNGPMLTWLAADLAATTNYWIIAYWHHPPYSKGEHDSDLDAPMIDMRQNALPILEAHGVDLVLCGHSHSYERSVLLDGHYGDSTTFTNSMVVDDGDGRLGGDGPYKKPAATAHEGTVYVVAGSSGKLDDGSLDHPVMITSFSLLGSLVIDVEGTRLDVRFVDDTGVVRDEFTLAKGVVLPPPQIDSPSDGLVVSNQFVNVAGMVGFTNGVTSILVTNTRGGSVSVPLDGTHWAAPDVFLHAGTNVLLAASTDGLIVEEGDSVTVVRVGTNLVNTSLHVTRATLTLGLTPETTRLSVAGSFGDAGLMFDPVTETLGIQFGDYNTELPANSLTKLKFKAAASPSNTLTSLTLNAKKRSFRFDATGFTLTNSEPFEVMVRLGTNELGPDSLVFPVTEPTGTFAWRYGTQLPVTDLFQLGKSKLTTNSFKLTGAIHVPTHPSPLDHVVYFGIGGYDEALPAVGWSHNGGNRYTYARPDGHDGVVSKMTLDLDRGVWSAQGDGVELADLANNPVTEVRIEIADFAASYRATLTPKGAKFSY